MEKLIDILNSHIQMTVNPTSKENRDNIILQNFIEEYYTTKLEKGKNLGSNRITFIKDNNFTYYSRKKNDRCKIRFGSLAGYDTLYYLNSDDVLNFLLREGY